MILDKKKNISIQDLVAPIIIGVAFIITVTSWINSDGKDKMKMLDLKTKATSGKIVMAKDLKRGHLQIKFETKDCVYEEHILEMSGNELNSIKVGDSLAKAPESKIIVFYHHNANGKYEPYLYHEIYLPNDK